MSYFCKKIFPMAYILNLESSTEVCSVSLAKNGNMIDHIENSEGLNHAKLLSVFANELMEKNKLKFKDLSAIAVSKGPGSYTGLRIGVSLAKGLCFGSNIPLIAVSPLQAMSWMVVQKRDKIQLKDMGNILFCPMIDARRMEVYTAIYNTQLEEVKTVSAEIIDENSFSEELKENQLIFFGNGSAKCKEHINSPNAHFIDDIRTSAQFMCFLSYEALKNNDFVDLAYFEPFYLKDFIAGIPKKNILKK